MRPQAKREVRPPRPGRAGGFTLAELLIALGIIGVCMGMAAMLFPVAIQQQDQSVNDTVGIMVCQNGLLVAKSLLSHPVPNADDNLRAIDAACLPLIDQFALYYPGVQMPRPTGPQAGWVEDPAVPGDYYPDTLKGCVVLIRQPNAGVNDYQLIVVSFTKRQPTNTVAVAPPVAPPAQPGLYVTSAQAATDNPDETEVAVTDPGDALPVGSPLIVVASSSPDRIGGYAIIKSATGDTVRLDRLLDVEVGDRVATVVEYDHGGALRTSPAMAVMVTRTAL